MSEYGADSALTYRGRRFYRQGSYYGGIATGIGLLIVLPILALFLIGHLHQHTRTTATPGVTVLGTVHGTATITLDDPLMTTGMALGLQRAALQFPAPFTNVPFTNVAVTTKAGHDIDLTADAVVVGLPVNLIHITLGPQITADGHLDFKVLAIYGVDLGPVDQLIENAINAQFATVGQGQLVKGFSYALTDVHTIDDGLVITSQISGSPQ